MPNRDFLTISPLIYLWFEDEKGVIVVENFFTGRRVYLEEKELSDLWKIITENSDYKKVKEKFCNYYDEGDLLYYLKILKRIGLIKIYYNRKRVNNEKGKSNLD